MMQFILQLCIAVAILAGQSYQLSEPMPPAPPPGPDTASQIRAGCVGRRSPSGMNACMTNGVFLFPGQRIRTMGCKVCTCKPNLVLECCSAGPHFTKYPPTCRVRRGSSGCEILVSSRKPWQRCTDGPVSAVG